MQREKSGVKLAARAHAKMAVQRFDVMVDGVHAQAEPLGDLLLGAPGFKRGKHLDEARAQAMVQI